MHATHRIAAAPADLAVHSWRHLGEMVIELELGFDGRLDEAVLAQAGELLLDVEPILGCRLVADPPTAHWEREGSTRGILTVTRTADGYERVRRTGLDATRGLQVALCLWRRDRGDRLLVKMTHVVGDGVGLQLLAGHLGTLYTELTRDPGFRPSPGAFPDRDLSRILSGISSLARARALWDFAWFIAPRLLPRRTHALPLPLESAGAWVPVIRHVAPPRRAALARYGKERGATLNDVFLAAAYRALASGGGWDGSSALRIGITVDLRRWCLPPAHAGTLANLSSFDCPFLIRDLGRSFDETLANVSALTRRRKQSVPGLALALLPGRMAKSNGGVKPFRTGGARPLRDTAKSGGGLTLSNEGPLDTTALRFGGLAPAAAHILPPFIGLPGLHVCLSGYGGALTLAAVTPANGELLVGRFLDTLLEELPAGETEPGGRRA
jgi:NRPS condensation-like uncharacterized protein